MNTNTKILEADFDYVAPNTLDEALSILSGDRAVKVLAGGTDLIVKLKMGVDFPMGIMLDINRIDELSHVSESHDSIHIGAAIKLTALESIPVIRERYTALSEAIRAMASPSVRNMATLGGNIMNASPVADCAGPVMCYGAKLVLRSKEGERSVDAEDFFIAPGVTHAQKNELLTDIIINTPPENTGAAFIKLGRVKSDIAKISATAVLTRDGDRLVSCRLALGSVAATPLFLRDISRELSGKLYEPGLVRETANRVAESIKPIDDNRTTAQYRRDMARLLVEQAMKTAWEKSMGL